MKVMGLWVLGGLLVFSVPAAGARGDALGQVRADFREAKEDGLTGKEVAELSARAIGVLEASSDKEEALEAVWLVFQIAREGAGRAPYRPEASGGTGQASGEAVARGVERFLARFPAPYPSDAIWTGLYEFLFDAMRRPAVGAAPPEGRQAAAGYKEFLEAIYQAAHLARVKAIALYVEVENQLVVEREFGGLSKQERAEAIAAVKRLQREYGALPIPTREETFGEVAGEHLFELANLYVGSQAPEIEGRDLDGVRFKLSDYRGKVVLLSFWANWCPPCVAMYARERALVERLREEPFALVGVNADYELAEVKQLVEQEQLNWRSFWAGPEGPEGPIPRAWNVKAWPMLYVLDGEGRIVYKTRSEEGLYAAVEAALADLKAQSATREQ